MKILAEDVIFTGQDGKETNLLAYMYKLIETLQMLKEESSNAKYITLEDDKGEMHQMDDVAWGCINAIEDLNDRLTALETRKVNKLR
jgi:hypothetical protein